ncbi:Hypothetical protein ORPV_614 [Orpheovirus IHUMI-LCC2]|uniref:Uncharacterized protein n=1 Tax=Orpheovirus IHUMI-LCC2 TaxID=2023057 RepID=A0A2I2L4Q3_9VIRU|nr:Hypothetical protein ORPV_614 [Orpheovirus IHUMI-LCC2]SNW62518.1 Hypothetical protein ORPV_614 [Orpheovirus IHUMI-LCC2]
MDIIPNEILYEICKGDYETTCKLMMLNIYFYKFISDLFGSKSERRLYFCQKVLIESPTNISIFYIDKITKKYQGTYTEYKNTMILYQNIIILIIRMGRNMENQKVIIVMEMYM